MPTDDAYHIKLNGGGFILVDGSYVRRSQQAYTPRFSTGDPGLGDLSFWQFLVQEEWTGGSGQRDFDAADRIEESCGWDFSGDRPRLAGGNAAFVPGAANPTAKGMIWTQFAKLTYWGRTTTGGTNKLILSGEIVGGGGQDAARTALQAASATQIGIDQINARSVSVWQRQIQTGNTGSARYLACIKNDGAWTIRFYDTAFTIELDYSPGTITWDPFLVVPVTNDKFLVIGEGPLNAASTDRHLFFKYVTLDNGAWSVASGVDSGGGSFPSRIVDSFGFDSSGVLYFAATESSGVLFDSDQGGSAVGLITAADMAKTGGTLLSEVVRYPDFLISHVASINGTIYLLGAQVYSTGSGVKFRNQIRKFPNTVIWEQRNYLTTARPRGTIKAFSQDSRHEAFFVVASSFGNWDSIMRLGIDDIVEEVGCFQSAAVAGAASDDNTWMAVCRAGRSFYGYDSATNLFRKYSQDLSIARAGVNGKCILEMSKMGANTPLIEKSLFSVTVELSEAVPVNDPMTVKVNGITVGTMVNADGVRKEILAEVEVTGATFQPRLEMSGGSQWAGELIRVSLRYVPTQFTKKAWGFAVRIDLSQQLLTGQRERRSVDEIVEDLEDAWKAKRPIDLVDLDGREYSVIMTEFSARQPITATDRKRREYVFAVELLEV